MIDLKDLNITKIKALHKIEFKTNLAPLMLRLSFYDCALDTFSSPIIFSREIKANLTESNESTLNATWPEEFLPCLQTAYNSIRLASQSKLLMLVWACGQAVPSTGEELLIGQVPLKMNTLIENMGSCYLLQELPICLANQEIGRAIVKIKY